MRGRPRKLGPEACAFAAEAAREGAPHVEIAAAIQARFGVRVDARTVGRALASMGRPARPSKGSTLKSATGCRPTPSSPVSEAFGPVIVDRIEGAKRAIAVLEGEQAKPDLPIGDRVRISAELRALRETIAAAVAFDRAKNATDENTEQAAAKVREKLERWAAVITEREAVAAKRRAATLATLAPNVRVAVESVLAAERVRDSDVVPRVADPEGTHDDDQEEPHAATS